MNGKATINHWQNESEVELFDEKTRRDEGMRYAFNCHWPNNFRKGPSRSTVKWRRVEMRYIISCFWLNESQQSLSDQWLKKNECLCKSMKNELSNSAQLNLPKWIVWLKVRRDKSMSHVFNCRWPNQWNRSINDKVRAVKRAIPQIIFDRMNKNCIY